MTSPVTYQDYEAAKQMTAVLARESGHPRSLSEDAWMEQLRSACSGSSGIVMLVVDYGPILPRIGSSSYIVDHRPTQAHAPKPAEPRVSYAFQELMSLSVVEQVQELVAALSLNKSLLAQLLRVTRPTVYSWLQGKEPNTANTGRLHTLLRILVRTSVSGATPLNARFVREPMDLDGPSIVELLAARELDETRIVQALEQAQTLADAASHRRTTREERLRALGFEEPTSKERRHGLAQNLALKDWPSR